MKVLLMPIIGAALLFWNSLSAAQEFIWAPEFPVGSQIPTIDAPDQTGSRRSLGDLSGEKGLLLVLSRSFDWCPYCIAQLQQLVDVVDEFDEMGFNVATMTYDSLDTLKNAEIDYETRFPLLRDEDTRHVSALGILNTDYEPGSRAYGIPYPGIFLLNSDGTVLAKFAEEDYRNRPDFGYVLEAARQL
jgi:peroxiredoxin